MDLLSVIRRWHHRDGLPIREIKRQTGLSRIIARQYLVSDVVEPRYPTKEEREQARSLCRDARALADPRVGAQPQAPP